MGLFDRTQIEYWSKGATKGAIDNDSRLSYTWLWFLSIFGGFIGLDHLYLRSPLTAVLKTIVNILGFGVWWLYDLTQTSFNKDVVQVFGLGIPGLGPEGIGAGVLTDENPGKKHLAFFIYGLALILGGLFAADSFVLGKKSEGLIRIVALISVIFIPLAIIWHLFNLVRFFFKTDSVIKENWKYFGAPNPESDVQSIADWLAEKFPSLAFIFNPFKTVIDTGLIPLKTLAQPVIDTAASTVQPIADAITATSGTVQTVAELGIKGAELGKEVVKQVGHVAASGTQALSGLTQLPVAYSQLTSGVTPQALIEAAAKQTGGSEESSGVLPFVFLATLGFIGVSGLFVSYRRFRQNEQRGSKGKNDAPPQPGTVRRADIKEPSKTT